MLAESLPIPALEVSAVLSSDNSKNVSIPSKHGACRRFVINEVIRSSLPAWLSPEPRIYHMALNQAIPECVQIECIGMCMGCFLEKQHLCGLYHRNRH